jgi:hypothetical protein
MTEVADHYAFFSVMPKDKPTVPALSLVDAEAG